MGEMSDYYINKAIDKAANFGNVKTTVGFSNDFLEGYKLGLSKLTDNNYITNL